jgi:hypothetical protein
MTSSITTLAGLYTEVTRLLDGEDVTVSELSTDSLTRLVINAQKRIYREVRSRFNEKAFSGVTVTSNLAALPADFRNAAIVHFGERALVPVDEHMIRDYQPGAAGTEKYFARAGSNLTFWPAIGDGTEVQGRYWFAYPDLADANIADNLLFQEADDLFIYGSLVESAPFFGELQKFPLWQAKYNSIVADLNAESKRSVSSAGRLQIRQSANPCGRYYRSAA